MIKSKVKQMVTPIYRSIRYNDAAVNFIQHRIKHDSGIYIHDLFNKGKYRKLISYYKHSELIGDYYYNINTDVKCICYSMLIDNIPVDYSLILDHSLQGLKQNYYDSRVFGLLDGALEYAIADAGKNAKTKSWLTDIKDKKCEHFDEALQRILFVNSLLWQTGHRLNGLGRLDKILQSYYDEDIASGYLTKGEIKKCILDFMNALHRDYYYKSNSLKGDTGQIIICGGLKSNGEYFFNDLTSLFIDCNKAMRTPDPKVLLRVAENMPRGLLANAIDCMKYTGGSPLLSNDKIVIKSMVDYGYSREDAYDYATSACWEPLVSGCSADPNNIGSLDFIKCLNTALESSPKNYDQLVNAFKDSVKQEFETIVNRINTIKFEYDPLLSVFIRDCAKNQKDVSVGGARYNDYGILTAGLGNAINAIININHLIYKEKRLSLTQLKEHASGNFTDNNLHHVLKNDYSKFGTDDPDVIELTNEIIDFINSFLPKKKNSLSGHMKFGLSSPQYLKLGERDGASLDGRYAYMPLDTHISCQKQVSYTELFNFASKIKYTGANVNGNVVDFIITPSFMDNNFEKFVSFIQTAIKNGFFQMQMNILDSKTLKAAKANPEQYKSLIVRVWGFSAYFVELPESYQDMLIKRAMINEGVS